MRGLDKEPNQECSRRSLKLLLRAKKKKTRGFLRSYDNYNSVFILIVNVFLLVNLFRSTKTISQGLLSFQTSP